MAPFDGLNLRLVLELQAAATRGFHDNIDEFVLAPGGNTIEPHVPLMRMSSVGGKSTP
jgi:hypothetical protein